ncbi:MAG: tsf [Gammaproteobacteria bacterium]|jgi:elongation factor Ts|nr:tsf [Gammaproteobacteria bacterium]
MSVSAVQVKELRERTGAGMMECKKALEVTGGDIQLAAEELRKTGRAKADKKARRVAAEGVVLIQLSTDGTHAVMVEINSETDFVARDENFIGFANAVAATALEKTPQDVAALSHLPLAGSNAKVEEARQALVAKVGENISMRRLAFAGATHAIGTYLHGHRIGVLVELDSNNPEIAKDIAMHIAACKPLVIAPEDISHDIVEKEREVYFAQAAGSGKPPEIVEKMVNGRLKKFLDEVSLLGQAFVKDPNITVAALLNKNRIKVLAFTRFEVGEGIEKDTEDFVEAVMSQVQGS